MKIVRMHFALALAVLCLFLGHAPKALAQDPVAACKRLGSPEVARMILQIPDAPTNIRSVRVVPAERDIPEICRVEGQIAPTIGFLLRMPTKTWNGKFMMGGCGGPCGNYLVDRIDPALSRNYAVVTTDMGHQGAGWGFMYNNLQGQIDFAYRSTHVTVLAAKMLVKEFYAKPADRNYYWGCSTGGRQGLVEAQRFPDDFEGIIDGAPVYFETGDSPFFLEWNTYANLDANGNSILLASKLPMIHDAVLQACDAKDGVKDGLIQNPLTCTWQPKEIACKVGESGEKCLNPAEVAVVEKIYSGAIGPNGKPLYWGMPRGSELQWTPSWIRPDGAKAGFAGTNSLTGFGAFFYSDGPNYDFKKFNMDTDAKRLGLTEALYNAANPDLRKFKAAGGKLIQYHGYDDNNIPAEATIDYYKTVTNTMGGQAATKDFYRLFMLPGVNHCRGGVGPGEADWITLLENWVEKGQAPEKVVMYHLKEPYKVLTGTDPKEVESSYTQMGRFPLVPGSTDRSRPVYPYPDLAQYTKKGDSDAAENWVPLKVEMK